MHRVISVYGRKMFSVALLFNSVLTVTCAIGLLYGFYWLHWTIYGPYLINGNLFWLAIAAAILNAFPAASVGKVHTGRLWFHHYVYGFFVMFLSSAWIIFFTSFSILTMFFVNTSNLAFNAGRFFFLGGLTLVLDDLPDVHTVAFKSLRWLKSKAHEARQILQVAQLTLGIATLYLLVTVSLSIVAKPQWITVANFVQMGTLFITALTCLASVKTKIWHKIDPKKETSH
jgi:hypothetical protein